MSHIHDEKEKIEVVEDVLDYQNNERVDRHLAVSKPESLVGLSDAEVAEIDRRATRKVDILLMPTLVALYILCVPRTAPPAVVQPFTHRSNYLDRQNISSAKIAGISADLGLTANDYSTAVAVLFAGYVSLQVPSNMLASKIKYPGICEWHLAPLVLSCSNCIDHKISAS